MVISSTNTLELSQPITISLNDVANIGFVNPTIDVVDSSTLADGMTVTGSGVPNGTTISVGGINGNEVTLSQAVDIVGEQVLQFGFLGAPITTDTFFVDDTAAAVGATVAAADDPTNIVTTVTGVDDCLRCCDAK